MFATNLVMDFDAHMNCSFSRCLMLKVNFWRIFGQIQIEGEMRYVDERPMV